MKKTLKFFALMMAACATMFVACGDKDNDNDGGNGGNGGNGGGGEQPPALQTSWSASFDGEPLDIAGYSDFQTNGEDLWLAQFASQAEGTTVYFPYIVMWMQGNATSNFSVYPSGAIELYKDTYYTAGTSQYGDWQYYATNSITCSALDLSTLVVSFTGTFTMYDLGEIVDETYDDPADCTQKQLTVTVTDAQFEIPSKGAGLHKMEVK